DSEAPRTNNGMAMKPVIATADGKTIVRVIRDELVSGTRSRVDPPKPGEPPKKQVLKLSYEAATLDQSRAKLPARRNEADARVEIPAAGWAYAGSRAIELLPAGTQPEPGTLYEFHYPAKDPRVLGIGMAATRDLISFLRYETTDTKGTANPARQGVRTALAFGISQSGRFLRDYVRDGFNQDEYSRKGFDGMLAHTAG